MRKRDLSIPAFFIDTLPDIPGTRCRELIRSIEIGAASSHIFIWLKQFRIAPYSYDCIDNRCRKSPEYIIEDLPPLRISGHFLLAFHISGFRENEFIAGRFCVPINKPIDRYFREMYIEYRIRESVAGSVLWCKVRGWFNDDIVSRGFFRIFAAVNLVMTRRQLRKVKRLSELTASGRISKGSLDLGDYFFESGLLWWILCRRSDCKGLIR